MNEINPGRPPENNLVWAILATVMCCLPLGIVAIVKSTKVEQLWYQGRYEEAQKAADDAKKWSIYSAVSIGVIIVLYLMVVVFIMIAQGASQF